MSAVMMAETVQAPKFEEHFWGEGNKGFDVLLQNFKTGVGTSKELHDFIKERANVEDTYVKGLTKLSRSVAAAPQPTLGALSPMWKALHTMCNDLVAAHTQFVQLLMDLSREVSEYNIVQREKMKGNLKGEVDSAQDSLRLLQTQEASLQRAKKNYTMSVEQLFKQQGKMEKAKGDINPKTKQQAEGRLKQAENWMDTMKTDYKLSVEGHTQQLMEFQGKMHEACQKFESMEEEHLAQMITFIIKMNQSQESVHTQLGKVHQKLNEEVDTNSVENLLSIFVKNKGTGKDRPNPEVFRSVNIAALATLHASPSHSDPRARSPSTDSQRGLKPEKTLKQRMRFKKKTKQTKGAPDSNSEHVISIPRETIPAGEVDEEGYSIRPEDAAAIRGFPDENTAKDSDDSDYEDEFQNRVRQVQIRDTPQDLPTATVDDIRASVQTLKLGSQYSPSTRIRKATSSQSLNNVLSTPPMDRRAGDANSTSVLDPVMSSLLDSDISLSPSVGMAAPLQPLFMTALSADPTETLRPSTWSQQPAPLLPSPFSPPTITLPNPTTDTSVTTNANRPVPKPRRAPSEKHHVQNTSPSSELPKKQSQSKQEKEGDVDLKLPGGWTSSLEDEQQPSTATLPSPLADPHHSPHGDSPKSESSSSSSDAEHQSILSPPLPNPRRNTRQRGSTPEQRPISPLVTSRITVNSPSLPSQSATTPVVPLAIAFQETCNAIFKGTNLEDCVVKVTGEMVVSFPANFLGVMDTHDPLRFQFKNAEKLKLVLHNQILLTKEEDGYTYQFNTPALGTHLKNMAEKKTSPFYNMQIIKYEVDIADGSKLPLKVATYWKCETAVTNFRFDYTYVGSNMPSVMKPPLTHVSVCVPVNGGVRNTLSKPSGNWLADKQQITWKIGEVAANEVQNSIHAKFDVSEGPSSPQQAVVKFVCDGSTLSGVDVELGSAGYKVSLLKKKFTSGKYVAEMKF